MTQPDEYKREIDQHINFLDRIIQRPSISDSVRQKLSHQIRIVKKRRTDPHLYLAIIGEFSSGKSTFINALLRDNLLKTSALVATATATKIAYSDSFSARAIFRGSKPRRFLKNTQEEIKTSTRKTKIAWLPGLLVWIPLMILVSGISFLLGLILLPIAVFISTEVSQRLKLNSSTLKDQRNVSRVVTSSDVIELGILPKKFVRMVTSEEELARDLDSFEIFHPANFLNNGIVIIDTPGTNADNDEHGKITRTVVENEADAAVIVIPANQPVSDTLVSFLSGPLYQYIHRCVFVVTKMDTIRSREQSRLIGTIQRRLREKLKIEQLFLAEAAPQIVIC